MSGDEYKVGRSTFYVADSPTPKTPSPGPQESSVELVGSPESEVKEAVSELVASLASPEGPQSPPEVEIYPQPIEASKENEPSVTDKPPPKPARVSPESLGVSPKRLAPPPPKSPLAMAEPVEATVAQSEPAVGGTAGRDKGAESDVSAAVHSDLTAFAAAAEEASAAIAADNARAEPSKVSAEAPQVGQIEESGEGKADEAEVSFDDAVERPEEEYAPLQLANHFVHPVSGACDWEDIQYASGRALELMKAKDMTLEDLIKAVSMCLSGMSIAGLGAMVDDYEEAVAKMICIIGPHVFVDVILEYLAEECPVSLLDERDSRVRQILTHAIKSFCALDKLIEQSGKFTQEVNSGAHAFVPFFFRPALFFLTIDGHLGHGIFARRENFLRFCLKYLDQRSFPRDWWWKMIATNLHYVEVLVRELATPELIEALPAQDRPVHFVHPKRKFQIEGGNCGALEWAKFQTDQSDRETGVGQFSYMSSSSQSQPPTKVQKSGDSSNHQTSSQSQAVSRDPPPKPPPQKRQSRPAQQAPPPQRSAQPSMPPPSRSNQPLLPKPLVSPQVSAASTAASSSSSSQRPLVARQASAAESGPPPQSVLKEERSATLRQGGQGESGERRSRAQSQESEVLRAQGPAYPNQHWPRPSGMRGERPQMEIHSFPIGFRWSQPSQDSEQDIQHDLRQPRQSDFQEQARLSREMSLSQDRSYQEQNQVSAQRQSHHPSVAHHIPIQASPTCGQPPPPHFQAQMERGVAGSGPEVGSVRYPGPPPAPHFQTLQSHVDGSQGGMGEMARAQVGHNGTMGPWRSSFEQYKQHQEQELQMRLARESQAFERYQGQVGTGYQLPVQPAFVTGQQAAYSAPAPHLHYAHQEHQTLPYVYPPTGTAHIPPPHSPPYGRYQ